MILNIFIILLIINIVSAFINFNRYNKFKTRLFKVYNLDENFEKDFNQIKKNIDSLSTIDIITMDIIGGLDELNIDKMYFIVGNHNNNYDLLKNDMETHGFSGLFAKFSYYKPEELKELTKLSIDDIYKIININNNFLIFNDTNYIGGLFEMYDIIYKDV
jgi:hypothetical protein